MTTSPAAADAEAKQRNFERILAMRSFDGLKAIVDSLTRDRVAICNAMQTAKSYEDLLFKLGYSIRLTKQIHVQDAFSRMGPASGIRAVLPYFNIPAQSAVPTLVNYDSTVTMTADAVGFFDKMLLSFRAQMNAAN